jgi:acyl-CoA thioesterase I
MHTEPYLKDLIVELKKQWPDNKTINIVCHGHSVPSGYFATPMVDTFNAYPHLLHRELKARFPFAVINVIVTGIGGEHSETGNQRFFDTVLCHKPDLITIDYGLNDRGIGLEKASAAWSDMITQSLNQGSKVILLTPTPDQSVNPQKENANNTPLHDHAKQIRKLSEEFNVGLSDSFSESLIYAKEHTLSDILSWSNHPNLQGHQIVTKLLMRYFEII